MPQPTLADVLPGATQTATEITIPKSALIGLTANANNTGDQVTAGITSALLAYYTPTRRGGDFNAVPALAADLDVSVIAELGRKSIETQFDLQNNPLYFEEQEISLRFFKPDAGASFDPDNY